MIVRSGRTRLCEKPHYAAYKAGLRRRGGLTFWVDKAALAGWQAPRRSTPSGQPRSPDLAVDLALTLRLVFHLALRPCEGTLASVTADGAYDRDPVVLNRMIRDAKPVSVRR